MKKYVLLAACIAFLPAFGANLAGAAETQTPAIATPDSTNATAPVPGKNSFTEDQARQRLTEAGYSDITGLKLDDQGFWVATATRGSAPVRVTMDYQGNIVGK